MCKWCRLEMDPSYKDQAMAFRDHEFLLAV